MESHASPRQENDEESLLYSSRHEHGLILYEGLAPYTCSGCKELGANMGYKCHSCTDLVLHEVCASLPDEYIHPFHKQSPFKFRAKTHLRHHCDACGDVVRGFVFESRSAHLRLHPLCMALPVVVNYGGHKCHALKLIMEKGRKLNCSQCSQTNFNWRYRCEETACGVNLDMNCVKVDFHELWEHGITKVARHSRKKHVMEKLSSPGKYLMGKLAEGVASEIATAAAAIAITVAFL